MVDEVHDFNHVSENAYYDINYNGFLFCYPLQIKVLRSKVEVCFIVHLDDKYTIGRNNICK